MGNRTQNSENCGVCGPNLFFVSIGASEAVEIYGQRCLNNEPLPDGTFGFLSSETKRNGSYTYQSSLINPGVFYDRSANSNAKGAAESNYYVIPMVDQYGRVLIEGLYTSRYTANSSHNGKLNITGPDTGLGEYYKETYREKSKTNITCATVRCRNDVCLPPPCGYVSCQEDCETEWETTYSSHLSGGADGDKNKGCGAWFPGAGEEECSSSCQTSTCFLSENVENSVSYPGFISTESISTNALSTTRLGSASTRASCKAMSVAAVNTRIAIQEFNREQDPCGTRCDSGNDQDDCWIGGFAFYVGNNANSTIYSRAKVKVAATKEAMEPYSNIAGKVYFYENSVPNCCGEGSPIIETSFSLGRSANFKRYTQCATNVYNFDSDEMQAYAGSTIVGCIKVTQVSFT